MNPPTPAQVLDLVLGRFARLLRWWSALRGLARWTLQAAAAAACSFTLDYGFEPDRPWRLGILVLLAGPLCWFFARWVLAPLFVRWSRASLALALERRVPALEERVMTAVELPEFPAAPALLGRVHREAAELAQNVLPAAILSIRSTVRLIAAAGAVCALVLLLAAMNWDVARTWWRRAILLESDRYPRATTLTPQDFPGGIRKVGRGRDVEVVVAASRRIPERATLELANARSSGQRRHVMAASSNGEFRHPFRTVVQPIEFTVQAGDERTGVLRLEPVTPPGVSRVEITTESPSYTGLPVRTVAWTNGPVKAVQGSNIAVRLTFDHPIATLAAKLADASVAAERHSDTAFVVSWEAIETMRLNVRYVNADGVDGDEPFSLEVAAVPDRPPAFEKVEPANVGPAVTRLAALPTAVTLADDFGVEQASFVLTRQPGKAVRIAIPELVGASVNQRPLVELGPLGLKEGDKFSLLVEASDLPAPDPFLGEPWASRWQARTVRSPSFTFEVVSPEELQSRLAGREINYRQRFEQTLRECRDARRTLADAAAAKDAGPTLQRLRVEEALQTLRKTGNETRELAAAFFGLVEEFRNNRVGASGMLERLQRSVASPLQRLAEDSFTTRVRELQAAVGALGTPTFPKAAEQATQGIDLLLREGEAILAAMRKMENFNELVTALRSLREEQNKLLQETKEERKRRILDLVK